VRVVPDELDQGGNTQRAADVVDVQDEDHDADDDEEVSEDRARPGTELVTSKLTSRSAVAWTKVATKRPIAIWLGLSLAGSSARSG
jgi:hypothetical protein